ncbi:hypothetical protein MtrunA17_Chr3g0104381 [Medicago truncatula]|nr:hypothetical protein MtrunA17_Chr3g0104381 [Medicago truncatula]
MSSTSLIMPQFIPQSRLVNNMSDINQSRSCHTSQPMQKSSVGGNSEQSQLMHVSGISGNSQQSESRPINTSTSSIDVPSSMSLLNSETTNFSKEVESSLLCLGTPYQFGDFQPIMGLSELNNNSYRNQVNHLYLYPLCLK